MSNSTRRVQPTVYDAEDHERAAAIRKITDDLIDLLNASPNYNLDRFHDDAGEFVGGQIVRADDYEERLAKNVQYLLEAINNILKQLDACNGKLASDDLDEPLSCVVAIAMCDVMKQFLDNKTILMAALDVIAKMVDTGMLCAIDDVKSMPNFKRTFLAAVCVAMKLVGSVYFERKQDWGTLENVTNVGPERENQVDIDNHLAQAFVFMQEADIQNVPVHKVVECAVLLNSVLSWHLMTKEFEDYYLPMVMKFALWLVNSFRPEETEHKHLGVLGCQLLYNIAVRNIQVGEAQHPEHGAQTQLGFRQRKIPERLMLFKGFSDEGDKYIREIERRVPPAEAGTQRKRAREPSPEAAAAGAAPAARGLGGSA